MSRIPYATVSYAMLSYATLSYAVVSHAMVSCAMRTMPWCHMPYVDAMENMLQCEHGTILDHESILGEISPQYICHTYLWVMMYLY